MGDWESPEEALSRLETLGIVPECGHLAIKIGTWIAMDAVDHSAVDYLCDHWDYTADMDRSAA